MRCWLRYALLLLVCVASSADAVTGTLDDGLAAFRDKDYARAFEVFAAQSKEGDARATFYLSLLYRKGLGVVQNESQSLYLLKQAAEGGDPMAQYNLGNQYNRQGALGYHPGMAAAWWEKAAKQGLALAQHNMGSLYALGRGVDQDLDKARYWYRQAAKNGSEKSAAALQELDQLAAQAQSTSKASRDKGGTKSQHTGPIRVNDDWIAAQAGNSFTLQLTAAQGRDDVERLASSYPWRRELLIYHIGTAEHAMWALGYGVFGKASTARQAVAELPKKLQAGRPWPRALADIKKRLVR